MHNFLHKTVCIIGIIKKIVSSIAIFYYFSQITFSIGKLSGFKEIIFLKIFFYVSLKLSLSTERTKATKSHDDTKIKVISLP